MRGLLELHYRLLNREQCSQCHLDPLQVQLQHLFNLKQQKGTDRRQSAREHKAGPAGREGNHPAVLTVTKSSDRQLPGSCGSWADSAGR